MWLVQQWPPQNASQPEAPGASPISQSWQTSRHLAIISAKIGAAALGVLTARRRRDQDLKIWLPGKHASPTDLHLRASPRKNTCEGDRRGGAEREGSREAGLRCFGRSHGELRRATALSTYRRPRRQILGLWTLSTTPALDGEVVCTARGNEALSRPEDSKAAERDGEAWFPSPKQTSVIREDLNVLFQTEEDHQPQEGHVPGEKRPEGTRLPLVWLRRPFSDTAGPRQGPSRALTFTPKLSVPGIPA
ncbi:unnamed protein product [Rangifer tarandus platyrhynchus]|uniref:Uncharacterized protein n=1 Tax=Rangifer tarandus platyrhynchus TaxID=3082113 RepID=A0ABN8XWU4_RANTA|nr:unnamed protein product [Rangifer tarandus platyrhynchus]